MSVHERGRPKTSSRGELEDAATQLFLEQGYHHTTVDEVARRAGISRASFFNYFPEKSDVLWVDVDRGLEDLATRIAARQPLGAALRSSARTQPSDRIPLIASQSDAMGLQNVIRSSGGYRVVLLHGILQEAQVDPEDCWLIVAALVQSVVVWAQAAAPRPELSECVEKELVRLRGVLGEQTVSVLF
jgi:AcrR family transcriptional regulator